MIKHPLGVLYAALLGIVAFSAAIPMMRSGAWDSAAVDLAMAVLLIYFMLKNFIFTPHRQSTLPEKCAAWLLLIGANVLALLPTHDFPGSLSTAFAFTLLLCAFMLYLSGRIIAASGVLPAMWSCVFMPYHEEFMLLLSYPLRLSATVLSAGLLNLCGCGVIYSGTSLALPGVNIAITDACSGINQLDSFILIAFIAVQLMHRQTGWKVLHFAFIMPSIIIGNSLRIFLTVMLYKMWGEAVLQNSWHVALGYVQIILALAVFLTIGKIFLIPVDKTAEVQK